MQYKRAGVHLIYYYSCLLQWNLDLRKILGVTKVFLSYRTLGLKKSFLNQKTYVLKNRLYQQSFLNRDSFLNRAFLNRDSTVLSIHFSGEIRIRLLLCQT